MTKFDLYLDGEKWVAVNPVTGEVRDFTTPKTATKKKKVEENTDPTLTLLDNKYQLSSAAVELMSVQPDDHIDIKYEKLGKTMIPIIGSDAVFGSKQGNRLTKTFTVSCRGKGHDTLAEYGTVFDITPHETKDGIFKLVSRDKKEVPSGNDDIEIPEDVVDELNIEDYTEEEDNTITNFDFNFD